jgi:hypothetical protein
LRSVSDPELDRIHRIQSSYCRAIINPLHLWAINCVRHPNSLGFPPERLLSSAGAVGLR